MADIKKYNLTITIPVTVKETLGTISTAFNKNKAFVLRFDESVSVTLASGTPCTMNLLSLDYDKCVYQPCEIKAVITIAGTPSYTDLKNTFIKRKVSMELEGVTVAENYFVYKINPRFQKTADGTNATLELTIYSEDKLLTLDKYSKAYTARKLGDIFTSETPNFKLNGTAISTNATDDAEGKKTIASDLQLVKYEVEEPDPKDKSKTVTKYYEFRHPYLVQYNESFYDFLKRTANRCGEFLFFEHGKLQLGIGDKEKSIAKDYEAKASRRHYEQLAQSEVSIDDFSYNYLSDNTGTNAQNGTYHYSNPLVADDYLADISTEYTNFDTQFGALDKWGVSVICTALQGTSFSGIVSKFGFTSAWKAMMAGIGAYNINFLFKKAVLNPYYVCEIEGEGDDVDITVTDDHRPGTEDQWQDNGQLREFGTAKDQKSKISASTTTNMYSKFYSLVRKAEKAVGEEVVHLEFDSETVDLQLGDLMTADGINYIVTQVKGCCSYTDEKQLIVVQHVVGIPLYKIGNNGDKDVFVCIPPMLPDNIIRESQPQVAFITGFMDPKKIGRVRVRFAWQETEGSDSTPWIRVSLPFATDGGGVKFTPNPGDEVLVSFEEGNVERPYVSGYLLSERSNASWKAMPDRAILSKNGHGITFNDGKDGGSFLYNLIPAFAFLKSIIPVSAWGNWMDKNEKMVDLSGGMTLSDRYGLYKISMSSDTRSVLIQSAMGNITLNAFTGINITAPNGDINIVGKNVNISASNKVNVTSGLALQQRFINKGGKTIQADGTTQDDGKGTRFVRSLVDVAYGTGLEVINATAGKILDLSLIRTLLEVFIRPIDGTLQIKSFTYVKIEAGKGSASIPFNRYHSGSRVGKGGEDDSLNKFGTSITSCVTHAEGKITTIRGKLITMCNAIADFNAISGNTGVNKNESAISFEKIKTAAFSGRGLSDSDYKWDNSDEGNNLKISEERPREFSQNEPQPSDFNNISEYNQAHERWQNERTQSNDQITIWNSKFQGQNQVKRRAQALYNAIINAYNDIKNWDKPANNGFANDTFKDEMKSAAKKMGFLKIEGDLLYNFSKKKITKGTQMTAAAFNVVNLNKMYRRKMVYEFIEQMVNTDLGKAYGLAHKNEPGFDDASWDGYKKTLGINAVAGIKAYAKDVTRFKNWFATTVQDPWKDTFVNRKMWDPNIDGQILLSDDATKTLHLSSRTTDAGVTLNPEFTNKHMLDLVVNLANT